MAYQDKREFDKYLKYLTQKMVQVIVQSREGTKMRTKCNPSETDWFNLSLPERRDIISQLKRDTNVPYPQHREPINVIINIETSEGDTFPIEVWSLAIDTDKRDVTVSVSHTVYPHFSLLLKSLLALTRVVPAYQLSRKNGDVKFNYIISSGTFNSLLNENEGEVSSPFGTVSLIVEYKTTFVRHKRNVVKCSALFDLPHNENDSLPTNHDTSQSSSIDYPFAAVLPKAIPSVMHSPSLSEGMSPFVDRQSSDDMSSVTVHSNQDGYLVLDLQERPAFGSSHQSDQGLTDLLYLSSHPLPFLDMFSEGTDITAAFNYLDKQHNSVLKTS